MDNIPRDKEKEKKHLDFDVDDIIFKILQAKSYKVGKEVNLLEAEIRWLIIKAKGLFMEQPVFLELNAPMNVCGK